MVAVLTLLMSTGVLLADYVVIRINISTGTAAPPMPEKKPPMEGIEPTPEVPPTEVKPPPPPPPTTPPMPSHWFLVVLETETIADPRLKRNLYKHRWGTMPTQDSFSLAGSVEMYHVPRDTLARELETRWREWSKGSPLQLADWLLRRWNYPGDVGQFEVGKRFADLLGELRKSAATKLEPADRQKAERLLAVDELLRRPLPTPDVQRLPLIIPLPTDPKLLAEGHYAIVHAGADIAAAQSWRRRLEHLFAGYYYWFALRGVILPLPPQQLLCVLAENQTHFNDMYRKLHRGPLQGDAFYAGTDDLLVLAPSRQDDDFARFLDRYKNVDEQLRQMSEKVNEEMKQLGYMGKERAELTLEKLRKGERPTPLIQNWIDQKKEHQAVLLVGQMFAAALPAALEEGAVASVTQAGLRQLAAATHCLPTRLVLPQAIREGFVAHFETPRSNGEFLYPTFYSGLGNLHWTYLDVFRSLISDETRRNGFIVVHANKPGARKVKIDQPTILRVLTDVSFQEARYAPVDSRSFLETRARAEAWALTYFFLDKKLPEYMRFLEELDRLPRDFELTPAIVEEVFARSFGIQSAADPRKADPAHLNALEAAWIQEWNLKFIDPKITFKGG